MSDIEFEIPQHHNDDNKGGFFDLDKEERCMDLSHNPPTHLCIPAGKGYKHVCPSCGYTITLKSGAAYY